MSFDEFHDKVQKILSAELPKGKTVMQEGKQLASNLKMRRSSFSLKMGVSSELEYKRQCIKEKKIMYHCHIGMSSWEETATSLKRLDSYMRSAGFIQDRAGICLDRRMGLPAHLRDSAPAETGPMLESMEDWLEIGSAAPIQPHMGDFMIGFPSSTENTIFALQAGVTTIGNLSQFFSHEVPLWRDQVYTTIETVKAISLMGALREQGALLHSYLDDGLGALFLDCATVAGWALLEKYIVEDLLGAKLAHCMGGLVTDPVKRSGWVFALDKIHKNDCIGSMFFGDTISFTKDFNVNRGLVAEYLSWDIMTQLACPTGHAVLSMPVTEAIRAPSLDEIIEAQILARRIEATARRMFPFFDFSAPRQFAETVSEEGEIVFKGALQGLRESGVDVEDPVQLLYVLKKLGPAVFEEMFGAGKEDSSLPRGRVPILPNDIFEKSRDEIGANRHLFAAQQVIKSLRGKHILLASTDVHEHALYVIHNLLQEAKAFVVNAGSERNPDDVAVAAMENRVDAVLISTHNGMALEYAKVLLEEMEERNLRVPILMGGVLNQKVADSATPVNVEKELAAIGIIPVSDMNDLVRLIIEMW